MHRLIPTVLALLVVTAGVPLTASAQDSGGVLDGFEDDSDLTLSERAAVANEAISGLASRLLYDATNSPLLSDETDDAEAAATQAEELTTTYNEHSDTLEAYANARFEASNRSGWDVIRIDITQGDATETRYLVAEVDNGTFTNSSLVSETNKTVDATLGLEDYAAANAANELESFVENYAEEDKDIDRGLRRRLAQQYLGDVTLPDGVMP